MDSKLGCETAPLVEKAASGVNAELAGAPAATFHRILILVQ
jgi:hypothetical protein